MGLVGGLLSVLMFVPERSADAAVLQVGAGRKYVAIDKAYEAATIGDVILVHPRPGNVPYREVALLVKKRRITFRAAINGNRRVRLSGAGYDYSGRGPVPRAIFQFGRGADGCVVEGFELFEAHNSTHNAAGVRINQANDITIRNCDIHDNDMGVMSNGDGTQQAAVNQHIENCIIHRNGSSRDPGQNHNLYLGGTSVVISGCQIHHAVTGHNVKSRAHQTRIEYSFIHDSSNREIDLVDSADTAVEQSNAVLIGNVIVKDPRCKGNREVIHFGRDGSNGHDGTLYLVHNTIVTTFISPIVALSTPKAKARLVNNIIWDGGRNLRRMTLVKVRNGADPGNLAGSHNWLSPGLGELAHTSMSPEANIIGRGNRPAFFNASRGDFRLAQLDARIVDAGLSLTDTDLPAVLRAYQHPAGTSERKAVARPDLGAFEYVPAQ